MRKCAINEDLKAEHKRDASDSADFSMLECAKKYRDSRLVGALINAIEEKLSHIHISSNATIITQLILDRYFDSPDDDMCQELLSDESAIEFFNKKENPMTGKCEFKALPSADAFGGLLCITCGETFEKDPVCPHQLPQAERK